MRYSEKSHSNYKKTTKNQEIKPKKGSSQNSQLPREIRDNSVTRLRSSSLTVAPTVSAEHIS
ncbi:hypothetical protein NECAME_10999 [Necator americanus]|uniref:Uncharacterized protein n=1 Tax=Necator americanus TaxID=51031 RepID=W2T8L6_NECAM|nr:hypothetical protein NECAME_10999 [Necator americanus]ETN77541.1 hypothetical protein NECAME_10999 [Necator americanus]